MHTTHLGRAHLLSSAALMVVTMLAACDTDNSTAPVPPAAKPQAQINAPIIGPSIAFTIIDEYNNKISAAGAKFDVTGSLGTIHVADNVSGDGNPTVGEVLVTGLTFGKYDVCQIAAAPGFQMAGPSCFSTQVNKGTASVGPFFNPRPPNATFGIKDEVGNLLPDATFSFTDSANVTLVVKDNSLDDANPAVGELDIKLPHDGKFKFCEAAPPPGFVIPAWQQCMNMTAKWGKTNKFGYFVNYRPFSADWAVSDGTTDGNGTPTLIGGGKFKVTFPNGATLMVDDNGQNDYDVRPGRLAAALPMAGVYSICQTQAAPGHWLPANPCVSLKVDYATPAWGDYFWNPEAQVPGPLKPH
jgi:hypothetical protein